MKKLLNILNAFFYGSTLIRHTAPNCQEEVKPSHIQILNSYSSLLVTGLGLMAVAGSLVQLV